jgi:hypothetical protein
MAWRQCRAEELTFTSNDSTEHTTEMVRSFIEQSLLSYHNKKIEQLMEDIAGVRERMSANS